MNAIIVRILTNTIAREKANSKLDVNETTNTLKIFLAGGDITAEQYGEFIEMVTPTATTDTNSTGATTV